MIISILSGLTLVVLRNAQDNASEARTRTQIDRIKALLMERLETYQTRIIPVTLTPTNPLIEPQPMDFRDFRRRVIAELIRVEIPFDAGNLVSQEFDGDAVDSGQFPQNSGSYFLPSTGGTEPAFDWSTFAPPSLLYRYETYFANIVCPPPPPPRPWNDPNPDNASGTVDDGNVPAELLYIVLATLVDTDGRSGLDFIRPSEIGDTDNDGALEILDGWGEPFASFYIRSGVDAFGNPITLDPTNPQPLEQYEVVIQSLTLSNRVVPP